MKHKIIITEVLDYIDSNGSHRSTTRELYEQVVESIDIAGVIAVANHLPLPLSVKLDGGLG
jgi:hypothetical protein